MTYQVSTLLAILAAVSCVRTSAESLSAQDVAAAISQAISPLSKNQIVRDNCTARIQMHLFAEATKIPLFLAETNVNLNAIVEQLQNAHNSYGLKMKQMLQSFSTIAEYIEQYQSVCPSGSFYVNDFDRSVYVKEQHIEVQDIQSQDHASPNQLLEEIPLGCDIIETDVPSLSQAMSNALETYGENSVVSVGDLLQAFQAIVSEVSNRKKMAQAQKMKAFHDVVGFMPDAVAHGKQIGGYVRSMGEMLSSFNVDKIGLGQMINQGIKQLIGRTNCIL